MDDKEQLTLLLKELVDRVKFLEQTVFSADNVLLKAGLVKVDGMKPTVRTNPNSSIDTDTLAKMDWTEIDELVVKLGSE